MDVIQYASEMDAYLAADDVVDAHDAAVAALADVLAERSDSELDFMRLAYEYVRDNIAHSFDVGASNVTRTASEVLAAGHGICFAKSHLLAALLRCKSVPAGFCYQKLVLDDETAPVLIYHGLNGVYSRDLNRWIRLDARGNKPGVSAQFSVGAERLAFPVRPSRGEEDGHVVYPTPDKKVLEALYESTTVVELMGSLPQELDYLASDASGRAVLTGDSPL